MELDEPDDDDYENIDAMLDEDQQKQVRRSDYLNWVYVDSDEDNGGGNSPLAGRNPPSVKLHNHPALKKSQSSNNMDSPSMLEALALKKQFEQHLQNLKSSKEAGTRPKNRAPPPPPGSKQRGDRSPKIERNSTSGGQLQSGSDRVHKRSQSDVRSIDYSEREHEEERRRGHGEGARGDGPSTSAGSGGSGAALIRVHPVRRSPHAPPKNPHPPLHPHRNKPHDPPPQFQRKHSPQTNTQATPDGRPPAPSYAPPPAPTVTSATGRLSGGVESAQKTPPLSGSQQHPKRPNPPRTGGELNYVHNECTLCYLTRSVEAARELLTELKNCYE